MSPFEGPNTGAYRVYVEILGVIKGYYPHNGDSHGKQLENDMEPGTAWGIVVGANLYFPLLTSPLRASQGYPSISLNY